MENQLHIINGNIVDVIHRRIYTGEVHVLQGKIQKIVETDSASDQFILPGFIDGHIHIESSMLVPSEFARVASTHGTVATVSDPHEIANVMGIQGVEYMIENASTVPFKFYFGAPSCVPATPFETAGATFSSNEIETLFKNPNILYLSEMMNVPGVLNDAPSEVEKLHLAKMYQKPVDGHSPELRGKDAEKYVKSGISTDHECVTIEEAREKISYGMTVQIREGSAARNLDDLMPLIDECPDKVMLCSDDRHPDDLIESHVRHWVLRAKNNGYDLFNILETACVTAVKHYGLDVGLLQEGDSADFILVDNLDELNVLSTYVQGQKISENGSPLMNASHVKPINVFNAKTKMVDEFRIRVGEGQLRVMDVIDGQLLTKESIISPTVKDGYAIQDLDRDLLKITVVNRYENEKPAVGFIRNFGLKEGAIASSVAHDSHNIVAVGTTDEALCQAVNCVIQHKGGVCAVTDHHENVIPLPIAGIMSDKNGFEIGEQYRALDEMAKKMGSPLGAPFMTLSFMALLVIPDLKMSDKGLFNGKTFEFTSLFTGKA